MSLLVKKKSIIILIVITFPPIVQKSGCQETKSQLQSHVPGSWWSLEPCTQEYQQMSRFSRPEPAPLQNQSQPGWWQAPTQESNVMIKSSLTEIHIKKKFVCFRNLFTAKDAPVWRSPSYPASGSQALGLYTWCSSCGGKHRPPPRRQCRTQRQARQNDL